MSAKSQISDPKEDLRSGIFDLDRSHLTSINRLDDSAMSNDDIDEGAIDTFLQEEGVYPQDIKRYM